MQLINIVSESLQKLQKPFTPDVLLRKVRSVIDA
jgi:hypothetical protein